MSTPSTPPLKVFTCTKFKGHWPVGTSAIIIAPDAEAALQLLDRELASRALPQNYTLELCTLNLDAPGCYILQDGDY